MQWSDGVSPELPPERSIEGLMNHYDRHTKYCSACQKVGQLLYIATHQVLSAPMYFEALRFSLWCALTRVAA